MSTLYKLVTAVLCLATLSFSPLASADEGGPRTGPTFSYLMGSSHLQNVNGFNTPSSSGYQLGYQGRYLGVLVGLNHLGDFSTGGSTPSHVDVSSTDLLVDFRMYGDYASLFLYAGISNWGLTSTTTLSTNSTSGTSPVVGIGFKLGDKLGLLMTAMYYKGITDSDVLNMNIGVNF